MKLVLCPLKKEVQNLTEFFRSVGLKIEESNEHGHKIWRLPELDTICVVGGHGKVQFGIQTQFFLNKYKINHVYCVGAGGALDGTIQAGDVVVATRVIEHDYLEKFNSSAKLPQHHCNLPSIELAKLYQTPDFRIHIGLIASGDEDIVDVARAEELHKKTTALAVAWEGSGGARAAAFNKIPYTEIRGITDNARHDVANSFLQNLPKAMAHAGALLRHLLAESE